MKSVLKVTLALAAAALLTACTALRLAYDNADTYLLFRAKSYLDLDAKGSDELDERIDEFFAWHRRTALPQYARLSEEAAKRVTRGLSREDLVWGYDSLVAHARQSLRFAAERVAPLLDRLTPQQVAHMERRFAEDNRKFAREYLRGSEAERRKRRARRLEERLEDWLGDLSHVQARLIAAKLSETLRRTFIVENRTGASGNVGADAVAKAAPDGHLFGITTDTLFTVNPLVFGSMPFDPWKDLVPVTLLGSFSQMMVCNPSVQAKTLAELLQLARREKLTYASGGPGVPGHLAAELLLSMTSTSMTTPASPAVTQAPKMPYRLKIREAALPLSSTAATYTVSPARLPSDGTSFHGSARAGSISGRRESA